MNLNDMINQLPIDQLAAQLGVDPATARNAASVALPALLGGLQANAQDPDGAASLGEALSQHDNDLADEVIAGNLGVDQVDTNDGSNIVNHVFGGHTDQVVNQLAGVSGTNNALVSKMMQMLAPLVMSYLAKRFLGGSGGRGTTGSGGLADVLNSALGGSAGAGGAAGGGGLADILGQVLGGGAQGSNRSEGSAGGIDIADILGGLLGGGRR